MAPIGIDMADGRYTSKKSVTAAVALFVALAAVPALANTHQQAVVSRLSITGVATQNLPVSQELEQGTYQERFIRRLSGESAAGPGRNHTEGREATMSRISASVQESQELEQGSYQERFIRRLSGASRAGIGRRFLPGEEATQSGSLASLQASHDPEHGTYQERFIRRLGGETLPRAESR